MEYSYFVVAFFFALRKGQPREKIKKGVEIVTQVGYNGGRW